MSEVQIDDLVNNQASCETVVMQTLFRADDQLNSTTLNLAKELAKQKTVIFVEHAFTVKDYLSEQHQAPFKRRMKLWRKGIYSEQPFKEHPNLHVVYPLPVFPYNFLPAGNLLDKRINKICRQIWKRVDALLDRLEVSEFTYINSFDPLFGKCLSQKKVQLKMYHCVDNIAAEGYIAKHGVRAEVEFARDADMVITTSKKLHHKMSVINDQSFLVPNASDYDHFQVEEIDVEINIIDGPKILYVGSIDQRIDYEIMITCAQKNPGWQFVFVGPINLREFPDRGYDLLNLPNAHHLGARRYEDVPSVVNASDVCLIPFLRNDLTEAIYPLKVNEYLSCGKPVVTSNFSDLSDFTGVISVYSGADDLTSKLKNALTNTSDHAVGIRKQFAAKNTWQHRAKKLMDLIESKL